MGMRQFRAAAAALLVMCGSTAVAQATSEAVGIAESRWNAGQLADAEKDLEALLRKNERDDVARFAIGVTRLFRAAERVTQSMQRYGLRPGEAFGVLNMLGAPIPTTATPTRPPEPIRYEDLRKVVETFLADIEGVDRILAEIKDESVKLPLKIGLVRLDFDGDGTATVDEAFWMIYSRLNRQVQDLDQATVEQFVIMLDRGDVEWLRGYSNVLCALSEFVLAMDFRELFERTAHLFFANPQTPYPFLRNSTGRDEFFENILDLIAYIHLINFEVDSKRLTSALHRFEAMTRHSREMWKFVLAETDDDREWIPSPKQKAGVLGVQFTEEMVKGWMEFLAELDDILAGKKRVPFWRKGEDRGVNLRKAFTESKRFDLVMWVQGTGAAPYLEAGPKTEAETWDRFMRIFQGDFIGFALWVN